MCFAFLLLALSALVVLYLPDFVSSSYTPRTASVSSLVFFAWHEMKWNQMQIWDVRCVWVLHATTGQHGIITASTLAIWKQKMGYGDLCHRTHTPSTNINLFAEDVELPTNYLVARRVSIPRHRLPPHRTAPHHISQIRLDFNRPSHFTLNRYINVRIHPRLDFHLQHLSPFSVSLRIHLCA